MNPPRKVFVRDYPVRFGEIDHAGIMYYPAILDRMHRAFEDFWEEALGKSYAQVLGADRVGFPAVDLSVQFRKPFRFGETLRARIWVDEIGSRSIAFRYELLCDEEKAPRVVARVTTGVVDMDTFRARVLPDFCREALEPWRG